MERRRQREALYRLCESGTIAPGEIWGALKSWEGVRNEAEYLNLGGGECLEVIQTGYTYIFQVSNIIRREDREAEERRIKAGLAAGVLVIDARAQLVDVRPRLKTVVNEW